MTAESRSVVVRLSMEAAQYIREAQRVGAVGADAMRKVETSAHRASRAQEDIGRAAGRGALLAAAGLGVVLAASARFDKSMSAVQAATHETTSNMGQLRLAALEAGKDTVFSATEAAGAIEELAKAGVSTTDVIRGGLRGALDLAVAGNVSVQESAELAASAMNQFNLAGEDVSHIADLMAAAAGKAQGGVHELGAAFNQSALVASQMGLSIEETTASLAAFASQGLIGSDAGTSFKTMLLALNPQSKKAAELMDEIGFSAYDASGQFVGMEELARRLQTSLAGMSEQQRNATLQTLFGRDAIRAANALYEEGAVGIAKWTSAVDDSGYAAETAATRLDNLSGDIELLRGSLETALIGAGQGSQDQLRGIVQGVTSVVDAFNKLPPASQSALTGLLAISAVTAGGLWLGTKVVGKVTSLNNSLTSLSETSPKTARGLKLLAAAGAGLAVLEVAGAGISALQASIDETLPGVEQLTSRLLELKAGRVADLGTEFDSLSDSLDRIAESDFSFDSFGQPQGDLTGFTDMLSKISNPIVPWDSTAKSLREAGNEVSRLDEALANLATTGGADVAQQAFVDLAEAQGLDAERTKALRDLLPQYTDALAGASNSADLATDATDDYAKSTYKAADGTEHTAAELDKIRKAYRDAKKAAAETATSFLDYSKNADKAKVSLREWIKQMEDQAQALEQFTANAKKAAKNGLDDGLIKSLEQMGPVGALRMKQLANATDAEIDRANRAWRRGQRAVDEYVDATTTVPKALSTTLTVKDAQALQHVRDFGVVLAGLNDKTIYITTVLRTIHQESRLNQHAAGGWISGPGTGTSDSIPAMLSDGEYVIRAAAVNKYGAGLFDRLNAMSYARGGPVHLAAGGQASSSDLDDVIAALSALLKGQDPAGKTKKEREANERDILKALRDFTPKLSQGVDGVVAEIHDLRSALKSAGGRWTKAMQEQADALIEAARQHDIGKALKRFGVDVEQGADGVRSEVRDLRSAIRDAGGEWTDGLARKGRQMIRIADKYELAAAALDKSQTDLQAILDQQAAFSDQVGQSFNDNPFGSGLAGFDRTVGANTSKSAAFEDVLRQLAGQGLDGALFQQLAASGDLKTAIQLLSTGSAGIDQREQLFAAMQAAQSSLGGFAGGQVFGADVTAQQKVVADNTTALSNLDTRLERQEAKFDRMVKAVEDLPHHVGNRSYEGTKQGAEDGIKGVAGDAGRRMARGGR